MSMAQVKISITELGGAEQEGWQWLYQAWKQWLWVCVGFILSNRVEVFLASPNEHLSNSCILQNRRAFKEWFEEGNGGHWHTLIRRQHGKRPRGRTGKAEQKEQSWQITKGRKEHSRNKSTVFSKVRNAKGLRSSTTTGGERREEDSREIKS